MNIISVKFTYIQEKFGQMRNSIHIMLFIRVNIIIRLKRLSVSHVVQSMNNLTDLKIWRLSASNCLTIAWWLPELTAKLRKNWLKQRWQDNFSFIRLHTANPSLKIDLYIIMNNKQSYQTSWLEALYKIASRGWHVEILQIVS